jgi:hypothetical protein
MTAQSVGTGDSGLTKFVQPSGGMAQLFKLPGLGGGTSGGTAAPGASFIERNKKPVMILAILIAASALLPQVENQRKKRSTYVDPKDQASETLTAIIPPPPDPNTVRTAELHFKEGFREYRARNYLRAQVAFETALQIWSDHALARIYLDSTKKAMEAEAEKYLEDAKRNEEANRVRLARMNYEAVMRLFAKERENEYYKKAENRLLDLEKMVKDREK